MKARNELVCRLAEARAVLAAAERFGSNDLAGRRQLVADLEAQLAAVEADGEQLDLFGSTS